MLKIIILWYFFVVNTNYFNKSKLKIPYVLFPQYSQIYEEATFKNNNKKCVRQYTTDISQNNNNNKSDNLNFKK